MSIWSERVRRHHQANRGRLAEELRRNVRELQVAGSDLVRVAPGTETNEWRFPQGWRPTGPLTDDLISEVLDRGHGLAVRTGQAFDVVDIDLRGRDPGVIGHAVRELNARGLLAPEMVWARATTSRGGLHIYVPRLHARSGADLVDGLEGVDLRSGQDGEDGGVSGGGVVYVCPTVKETPTGELGTYSFTRRPIAARLDSMAAPRSVREAWGVVAPQASVHGVAVDLAPPEDMSPLTRGGLNAFYGAEVRSIIADRSKPRRDRAYRAGRALASYRGHLGAAYAWLQAMCSPLTREPSPSGPFTTRELQQELAAGLRHVPQRDDHENLRALLTR